MNEADKDKVYLIARLRHGASGFVMWDKANGHGRTLVEGKKHHCGTKKYDRLVGILERHEPENEWPPYALYRIEWVPELDEFLKGKDIT